MWELLEPLRTSHDLQHWSLYWQIPIRCHHTQRTRRKAVHLLPIQPGMCFPAHNVEIKHHHVFIHRLNEFKDCNMQSGCCLHQSVQRNDQRMLVVEICMELHKNEKAHSLVGVAWGWSHLLICITKYWKDYQVLCGQHVDDVWNVPRLSSLV